MIERHAWQDYYQIIIDKQGNNQSMMSRQEKCVLDLTSDAPLFQLDPSRERSAMVNAVKWNWNLKYPVQFRMFNILVDDVEVMCIADSEKMTNEGLGIFLNFLQPRGENGRLRFFHRVDDPKSLDDGKMREGRFPLSHTKKEEHLNKHTIIFGNSSQKTMTHAEMIPLAKLLKQVALYNLNPKRYETTLEQRTSIDFEDQLVKKIIDETIKQNLKIEYGNVNAYSGKFSGLLSKLFLYVYNSRYLDIDCRLTNIKNVGLLAIPSKRELISEINKKFAENSIPKTITSFSQLRNIIKNIDVGIGNLTDIWNDSGERSSYYLLITHLIDQQLFTSAENMIKFFGYHKNLFVDKWNDLEQKLSLPENDRLNQLTENKDYSLIV